MPDIIVPFWNGLTLCYARYQTASTRRSQSSIKKRFSLFFFSSNSASTDSKTLSLNNHSYNNHTHSSRSSTASTHSIHPQHPPTGPNNIHPHPQDLTQAEKSPIQTPQHQASVMMFGTLDGYDGDLTPHKRIQMPGSDEQAPHDCIVRCAKTFSDTSREAWSGPADLESRDRESGIG